MKIKRIIAVNLLFIVVLSTIGSGLISSPLECGYKSTLVESVVSTQLIANTQDASDEFRETAKVNAASETASNSENSNFIREISLLSFKVIRVAQYNSYLQKQLLQRPSLKLYLDQRSLII